MKYPTGNSAKNKTMIVAIIMFLIGVCAIFLAYRFAASEQARERLIWQNRISVVLNGRADVVSNWISTQKNTIQKLADNNSIRLYFSNLSEDLGLESQGLQAMQEYLLPLLNDRAIQNGFTATSDETPYEIRANIEKPKLAGLALTDMEGQIIISTSDMPNVLEAVNAYISAGANQDTIMTGPYFGETGSPTVAFISPIFGIEEDKNSSALGFLIGVKVLDDEFFNLLVQPGEMARTAKNYLVRQQGTMVHFIQNKKPQDVDFQGALDVSKIMIAESTAIKSIGTMVEGMNYLGDPVLAAGVDVAGTSWTLIRTIDESEALGQAQQRKRSILIMSVLAIISVGIMMALLWRHGISVRLQEAVNRQKALAKKHENLSTFMSVVTNSQPTEIYAVDENGNYTFVNLHAAIAAGSKPESMIGKSPSDVLGRAKARADEIHCEEVISTNKRQTNIRNVGSEEKPQIIKTDYLPLVVGDDNDLHEKGVLMVKEDITSIEQNRIKRELNLKSLVSTLTMIIGSRDPYSAAHSERVVEVSNVLCKELNVDHTTAATAELAAAMMNLGKILVPRELLIKPTNLTVDELSIIRSSMLKSADLIKDIKFEGPVCETLNQMQAHWDGSGQPAGLAGADILLSARIVSVANAFVGMVSARAHRDGMEMKKAIQLLMADADKIFDRRPVVALMNYLENKGGFEAWKHFGEMPD